MNLDFYTLQHTSYFGYNITENTINSKSFNL